jgi:hypothetical protein
VRIRILADGRDFEGETAEAVVRGMQSRAIFKAHLSLDEYMKWVCEELAPLHGVITITGDELEDRCRSFIEECVVRRLAVRMDSEVH